MVRRGEVWWYEDQQHPRRPFLILSRDAPIAVLHQVVAVPATTTIRGIPTEVALGADDGMPRDCCLTLDNITVIRRALCSERITTLSAERMHAVCSALAAAVACD